MTQTTSLSADIAYLRDLAEAGQNAPLLGGRYLAMWGALATLAYLGHYAIVSGLGGVGSQMLGVLWGAFSILGIGGQILLQVRAAPKAGTASAGNQVQAILFMVMGFMLFAYFAGVIARVVITGEGYEGFVWSVPLVLGLYGVGQIVTGSLTGQKPLLFAGGVALCGVTAAAFLTGSNLIWLVGAAVALLAIGVPGLMLMRAEPRETV